MRIRYQTKVTPEEQEGLLAEAARILKCNLEEILMTCVSGSFVPDGIYMSSETEVKNYAENPEYAPKVYVYVGRTRGKPLFEKIKGNNRVNEVVKRYIPDERSFGGTPTFESSLNEVHRIAGSRHGEVHTNLRARQRDS